MRQRLFCYLVKYIAHSKVTGQCNAVMTSEIIKLGRKVTINPKCRASLVWNVHFKAFSLTTSSGQTTIAALHKLIYLFICLYILKFNTISTQCDPFDWCFCLFSVILFFIFCDKIPKKIAQLIIKLYQTTFTDFKIMYKLKVWTDVT